MDALAVSEANALDTHTEEDLTHAADDQQHDNKFQKAITSWRSIDLSSLISQLDNAAAEIVANQKDALVERKDVAQRTKDFRKLDDAGKLSEYKSLHKSYQSFIDLLTNHNKTSSSAFLQVYTPLSEAPDPFPLLEASVESIMVSEETLPKLTSDNAELQKRVNRLAAQLDEAEQHLTSETKARREAEDGSGSRIKDIEASWAQVLEEKESNWQAKEKTLEEKVDNQDRLLKELKANYEVSQRLGQSEEQASLNKAASAELELMSSDLEKALARLTEMEARNEQLRVDLARTTSQTSKSSNDDATILRLQNENSALLRKLESARYEKDAEKRELDAKLRQTERQKASSVRENQELKSKLQKVMDYDEIKRELNMLRTIELSVDEEPEGDPEQTNGAVVDGKKDSLEQLLLARNKKLNNELTILRVSHQDLQRKLEELSDSLTSSTTELDKAQKLNASLENDLLQMQEEAANVVPSSGMSVAGTYTSRYPGSGRRGRSSPTSSIISGFDNLSRLGSTTLDSLRSGEAVGGGSGILPMIQAQRDRFKQKNQQLEEELSKTYATVTALRQEIASLQKDNLSLYEKTRYVSAYSRGSHATTSSSFTQAPSHTSVFSGADDGASDRWKSQYEAKISPFAAFRGREAARAYSRMSLPERMIFSLTRIVLATRTSRNLFAAYCMALHFLVFVMLYWTSAATGAIVPVHMAEAANAAMANSLKDGSVRQQEWQREAFGDGLQISEQDLRKLIIHHPRSVEVLWIFETPTTINERFLRDLRADEIIAQRVDHRHYGACVTFQRTLRLLEEVPQKAHHAPCITSVDIHCLFTPPDQVTPVRVSGQETREDFRSLSTSGLQIIR